MKKIRILALILAILLFFCACDGEGEHSPSGGADEKGIVNLAMRTPPSLNPAEAPWESCKNTFLLIYDGLFRISDTLEAVPVLAESYSVLSEGLEIMINLRTDITWHDGTPFTARDVVHTFETIRSIENSAFAENLKSVVSWHQIDDYTVEIFLSEPNGTVVYDLTFPILPAHFSDYGKTAIGTGAFLVESYDGKESLSLVPNETYFGGKPKVKGVRVKFVRTDDMTSAAFTSHAVDMVSASLQETVPFSQDEEMRYVERPSTRLVFLGMNTQKPLFASALTRRAISSLADRAAIAAEDYQGKAVAATSTLHPKASGYNAELSGWNYSLDDAREGLFAAGWSDLSGDGIIDLPAGDGQDLSNYTSFVCTLLTNEEDLLRTSVANRLVKDMNEVGISAKVESVPFETYLSRIESGDFDCFLGKVEMSSSFNAGFLVGSGGSANYSGYVSEALDRVIIAMLRAEDDISTKVSADDYQKVFSEEWPVVPLCFLDSGWYVWKELDFHADGYQNPYNCSHLWTIEE